MMNLYYINLNKNFEIFTREKHCKQHFIMFKTMGY